MPLRAALLLTAPLLLVACASPGRSIPLLHLQLAAAYRDLGQLDRALAAYRRAFRLDPGSAEAASGVDDLEGLEHPGGTMPGVR